MQDVLSWGALVASSGSIIALVRFWTRVSTHGFIEEDGEIWAPDGTLIAQSRQLALLQALSQD